MKVKTPVVTGVLLLPVLLVSGCGNDGAKAEMAREHVRKLNKAAEFFYVERKACPQSANDLAKLFTGQDDNTVDFSKDPWGNDFVIYQVGDRCHFKSLGADGTEGGDGFAADVVVETGVSG